MVAHLDIHRLLSGKPKESTDGLDSARVAAATMIQRLWRGRRNRAKDEFITPEIRWTDAVIQAKLQVRREPSHFLWLPFHPIIDHHDYGGSTNRRLIEKLRLTGRTPQYRGGGARRIWLGG